MEFSLSKQPGIAPVYIQKKESGTNSPLPIRSDSISVQPILTEQRLDTANSKLNVLSLSGKRQAPAENLNQFADDSKDNPEDEIENDEDSPNSGRRSAGRTNGRWRRDEHVRFLEGTESFRYIFY